MMRSFQSNSYLFGGNAPYIEELYESYLNNPSSVPEEWRAYFDNMQVVPAADGSSQTRDVAHAPIVQSFADRAKEGRLAPQVMGGDAATARKQVFVQSLIAAYRSLGNRWADLDPLKRHERPSIPELEPAFYDFTESDQANIYSVANTFFGTESCTLRELLHALRETYCATIGAEFMHITDPAQKRWMQERLESTRTNPKFSREKKLRILDKLVAAEGLEKYLHTRYVGQKRFSLEGGESFIPALDEIIQRAGEQGVQEIVIGMAHRGRLNVLVNMLGKLPKELFAEFEGQAGDDLPSGDVKYHKGFSSDVNTPGGPVHLSLAFNPSHLEIVDPVVEGSTKARQDRRGDTEGSEVLSVLVHGDAAFAGQGVVMETLNMAQTRGYGTGGTVHIVINNQIGFTTSDPRDSRSTLYCTDVVKMIEAPVLHVNGDDPEAVVYAAQVAMEFRTTFRKDIVLDIVCYRKLGHNEQDTPSLTQPLMYRKIAALPGTRKIYGDKLVAQAVIEADEVESRMRAYRDAMDAGRHTLDPVLSNFKSKFAVDWMPYLNRRWTDSADTAVPIADLKRLADRITSVPEQVKVHPLVKRVLDDRRKMGQGEMPLDWGMGEHLAFASLLASGYGVRLSGQDSGRGTFTHRHAVIHDQGRERWGEGKYIPLQNVSGDQGTFTVIDSVLSEEAVLGFEYGYSTAEPNVLVVWEGQFGDFVNGAQVVIDQFICSGETKWGRASGLTLMLPHGYEGQGPEHSSARMERFLQLCAENNMQVLQPTTPAQIFHALRRQMVRLFRKPLVIMTPKSLLRHKEATSPLEDLSRQGFQTVIGETDPSVDPKRVKRVIICTGRVYYDLLAERREREASDVAIVRVEQLYPFPHKAFDTEMKRWAGAAQVVWCQDEPQNQGAWFYIQHHIADALGKAQKLSYAGRAPSASPAVGYYDKHYAQLRELIGAAFGDSRARVRKAG
ncbi:MAG: 2-oxoglutarate dehydrogenase E1 component [Burkholderiaceae bacterium]|nr:2-oxoglutarate dehydrogenase E1 component [Burkholderiaceae bacterium]